MSKVQTFQATLLLAIKKNKILLAEKKRGWRQGIFNGLGGKVEQDETIEQAMIREAQEEGGITPITFDKVAIFDFDTFYKGERAKWPVHVFKSTEFFGDPVETEEMRPQWFDFDKIPYDKMWDDDILWMPRVLNGEKLRGNFSFDEDNKIIDYSLTKVKEF